MGKTYAIGDIHGALLALEQLIGRIGLQPEDRLIFLGDYVDGWSQSSHVLEYLIGLGRQYDCIFIKGNHDSWLEEWLEGYLPMSDWLVHGGKATIDSYKGVSDADKARHLAFLREMVLYHEETAAFRRLFVHAGFASMHGPAREHHPGNFYWDRTLWELALAIDGKVPFDSPYYPRRLLLYDEVFIGHTPTTNYQIEVPMHRSSIWNIDTGAAFMGRICAIDVDSKQFWQSDVVQTLYPNEKGRNR